MGDNQDLLPISGILADALTRAGGTRVAFDLRDHSRVIGTFLRFSRYTVLKDDKVTYEDWAILRLDDGLKAGIALNEIRAGWWAPAGYRL